jgi:hypothetical protein
LPESNQSLGFGGHPKIITSLQKNMHETHFLKYGLLACGESKQLSWSHMICLSSSFGIRVRVGMGYNLLMGWKNKITPKKKKRHIISTKKGSYL